MRALVVGGGSWGTAFSGVLARAGHSVELACRDYDAVARADVAAREQPLPARASASRPACGRSLLDLASQSPRGRADRPRGARSRLRRDRGGAPARSGSARDRAREGARSRDAPPADRRHRRRDGARSRPASPRSRAPTTPRRSRRAIRPPACRQLGSRDRLPAPARALDDALPRLRLARTCAACSCAAPPRT